MLPLMRIPVSSSVSSAPPEIFPAAFACVSLPYASAPFGATTVLPTMSALSRLAWKPSPILFWEESTPSIMRTSTEVPAGIVIAWAVGAAGYAVGGGAGVAGEEGGGADAAAVGGGAEAGPTGAFPCCAAFDASPVSLNPILSTSLVANICSLPSTSKRIFIVEPPRKRPCTIWPVLSSSVSARAVWADGATAAAPIEAAMMILRILVVAGVIKSAPHLSFSAIEAEHKH